ncbi:MAG: hypothetical protein NVS4B13_03240 [Candidatus Elarobacter sp.]
MNGSVKPSFVCAGRTAEGTAAAGYFLKNSWRTLYALYSKHGGRFDDDALAVELCYTPGAIIQSEIGRPTFGPVHGVAPAREPAQGAANVPVIRDEVPAARTSRHDVPTPNSSGSKGSVSARS